MIIFDFIRCFFISISYSMNEILNWPWKIFLLVLYSFLNYMTLQFLLFAKNFDGERLAFQKINGAAPSNFLRTSSYTYVSKHTANW